MHDDSDRFRWIRDTVLSVLRSDSLLNGQGRRQVLSRAGRTSTPQTTSLLVTWTGAPGFSPDMLLDRFLLSLHDTGMPTGSLGSRHVLDHATAVLRGAALTADNGITFSVVRTGRWLEQSAVVEHGLELVAFDARVPRAELDGRLPAERGVPATPGSTASTGTEPAHLRSADQSAPVRDEVTPREPVAPSVSSSTTGRPGSEHRAARLLRRRTGSTNAHDPRGTS